MSTPALGPRRALPEDAVDETLVRNTEIEITAAVKKGDFARAKEEALQLLRGLSTPKYERAGLMMLIDVFRAQAGNQDVDAALDACLNSFTQSDPLREAASYYVALYCYEKENYDAALKRTAAFSAEYPASRRWAVPLQMIQALCQIRLEKYKEALGALSAIITASPDSPEAPKAHFLTAWAYMFTQENDKARSALQILKSKYPDSQYAAKATQLLENLKAAP